MSIRLKHFIIYGFIILSIAVGVAYIIYWPVITTDNQNQPASVDGPVISSLDAPTPADLTVVDYPDLYYVIRDEFAQLSSDEKVRSVWALSPQIEHLPDGHPYGIAVTELLLERYLSGNLDGFDTTFIGRSILRWRMFRFQPISDQLKQYMSDQWSTIPAFNLDAFQLALWSLFEAPGHEEMVNEVLDIHWEIYRNEKESMRDCCPDSRVLMSNPGWTALLLAARNDESKLDAVFDHIESFESFWKFGYFGDLSLTGKDNRRSRLHLLNYVFSDEQVPMFNDPRNMQLLAWYALDALQYFRPEIPPDLKASSALSLSYQREEVAIARDWLMTNLSREDLQAIGVAEN